jgi:hypothetical protein
MLGYVLYTMRGFFLRMDANACLNRAEKASTHLEEASNAIIDKYAKFFTTNLQIPKNY